MMEILPVIHKTMPSVFPEPWATEWGQDEYGVWQAFAIGGVRQVWRWIHPGRFLMGSPPDEAERFDDELQHEVSLTRGFWLAATACTQALWRAVMGENPGQFNGEQLPVEQVSWEDVQVFIQEVNRRQPGLDLRLPTEAEWEWACRAGTTTPFSFGQNISPEQVNYNSRFPYADGQTGEYRGKTVSVGSLPANPWGLYEMHGNVWEWCADWYDEYPPGPVSDPLGPGSGSARVLRGGSWFNDGWNVRSASRYSDVPGDRLAHFGFRLARGHNGPGE